MGCACCSLGSFISGILHALERMSFCTICACFIFCMLFTILGVLSVGVGVGFHYCIVKSTVDSMEKEANAVNAMRSGPAVPGAVMRSVEQAKRRGTFDAGISRDRERRDLNMKLLQNNTMSTLHNTTNANFNITQDKVKTALKKIMLTKMKLNTTKVNLLRYLLSR